MENKIERGDIFFVHLDPAFGREIGGYKTRPVVVVSINDIHQNTRIVAVVSGTTRDRQRPLQNIVHVAPSSINGLNEDTFFQCHQVRAIDQGRMTSAEPVGYLSKADFNRIGVALRHSLGLP